MMNSKELKYQEIVKSAVSIFRELESIVLSIKNDFIEEQRQDPRLTFEMVENRLSLLKSSVRSFQGYANRSMSNWSVEKYCRYVQDSIQSFHREFDNPFLGSQRWYQRIVLLQEQLTEQARELDSMIE